jgi:hypothetical protein
MENPSGSWKYRRSRSGCGHALAWKLVDSPVPDGALFRVTVLSARDAWAVGSGSGALIEHWNGTRWSATPVP